jgi:hypothetical protein
VNIETSDRQGDGAQEVIFSYDDIVQSSFQMRALATSYDNLRTAIGKLQQILGADGVIRWIPQGSTSTYYLRRKPSPIPALFNGNELELYKAGALLEGTLNIGINRERLIRGATLLASVNQSTNSTLLLSSATAGPSSAPYNWVWDSVVNITTAGYGANVSNANQSFRYVIATTGTRNLRQTRSLAAVGDIWSLSFYAKASGGALCKMRAMIEFIDSGTTVLATHSGTLTTLSSTEQRLTVTTSAAPASTVKWRINLQNANGDATSYTVDLRRVQMEKASAVSQFRVGAEVVGVGYNAPGWKAMFVYNPGDANALCRISVVPQSGFNPVAFLVARRSEGLDVNLTEALNAMTSAESSNRTKQAINGVTLYGGTSGDTSSQADANATSGNGARTNFTNITSLVRRWRWVSTPTDPETLHGRWNVYCAIRPEVGSGTDTRYRVQLKWQAANRDPVINEEKQVPLDATDATTSVYAPIFMGTVDFNADAGDTSLTLEGWCSQDAGAGFIWWDVVYLIPADEQATLVQVPGFRVGGQGKETWLGSELTSAAATNTPAGVVGGAAVSGTKVTLDAVNEGAGSPPSTLTTGGTVWAAGRHIASATVDLRVPAGTAATGIGRLRIRRAPGPGATLSAWAATTGLSLGAFVKPTAGNLNTRTYRVTTAGTTGGAEPTWGTTDAGTTVSGSVTFTETTMSSRQLITKKNATSTRKSFVTATDADGTAAYEIVVVAGSGITGVSGKIHVLLVSHTNVRVIDSGYSAQMFGDLEVLQTATAAGVSTDDLVKQGPFITLGPGLNALWVDQWTLAPQAYDDITDQPLGQHEPGTYATVSVDVTPRTWG